MVKVRIKKIGINGEGIAYKDRIPIFCDGALKNELVDIEIIKDFKTYKIGKIKKLIEKSPNRRKPICRTQRDCLACPIMTFDRESQLNIKRELLIESLHKYAKINHKLVRNIHSSNEYHYRNQCKLPVKEINGKLVTGMYEPNSNHFVKVDSCIIHNKELEDVRIQVLDILNKFNIKAYNKLTKQGLRYIVIRYIENAQLTLVTGHKTIIEEECIKELSNIKGLASIFQSINTTKSDPNIFGSKTIKLFGDDTIPLNIDKYTFSLSPKAFFQLNTEMAKELYEVAISKIDKCNTLVEAYAGIGAMSILANSKAKEIYAIENNSDAVKDGKMNAQLNGIQNIEFILNDASEGLYKVARKNYIDTLLLDPPRSGLDNNMVDAIIKIAPKKIIYISCNPSTLAKNLNILKKYYHIRTIIPFDLFPNTPLVESITVLDLI